MSARVRLSIALVSTVLVGYVAVGSLLSRVLGDSTYGQLALFNEVVRIVLEAYVEPINLDRAMAGARAGMTDALDGDSAYLDPEELKAYQQGGRESEADVGLILSRRFSFLMVVASRPGSPAEKAGLRTGDLVKTIDERGTRPISPPVGMRLLRGAPGSVVKLSLLRPGKSDPVEVSLVRERLTGAPVRSKMLGPGVGYVKVTEVTARTAEDVRSELQSLRKSGARNLVLDLRGTAFGVPTDGVKVAELFLKGGVVTKLAGAHVPEQVFNAEAGRSAWAEPLAVLIDNTTSGPGEIVAAALLDAGRGPLVGEHTFGRAPVQKLVPLPEGGLVVTVARYLSPKGNAIHGKGIDPTVAVEAPDEPEGEPAEGAAKDPILDKAIELLTTKAKAA
jgi:carboxyl-terminal processing protease